MIQKGFNMDLVVTKDSLFYGFVLITMFAHTTGGGANYYILYYWIIITDACMCK